MDLKKKFFVFKQFTLKKKRKASLKNEHEDHQLLTEEQHIVEYNLSEVSGERVLDILKKILGAHSNPQDLQTAAVIINTWGEMNGVTVDNKKGNYPQDWLCEFQQLIEESVEGHFPILPVKSTAMQRFEFLSSTENMMFNEVKRLTPVLKDAGLLGYLIQSYHTHLLPKLNLLVNKDLSLKETFYLLQWRKRVLFSPDSQDVFSDCDPQMFSELFDKEEQRMLPKLKDEISKVLQNIVKYEEEDDENNERSMDDEWFIRVDNDVTQYLNSVIQNAKECSVSLSNSVQHLCLEEFHNFAKKYVNGKKTCLENMQPHNENTRRWPFNLGAKKRNLPEKREKLFENLHANFVYLCKIISTCMRLSCRRLPGQITNVDKCETVDVLKKLEDHALSIVHEKIKYSAQVSLESYFEESDEHIYNLTEEIEKLCESLPQTPVAEEIRTIIANLASDCVSRVYLDCMIKIKFKKLQKRWGNVEEKIKQNVKHFRDKFAELNVDDEQNQLLMRMTEVLFYCDVETLKLTCAILFNDFPEDSEQYLPRLLLWKKTLSEQQVREILDVDWVESQNPACKNCPHFLMSLSCCPCF